MRTSYYITTDGTLRVNPEQVAPGALRVRTRRVVLSLDELVGGLSELAEQVFPVAAAGHIDGLYMTIDHELDEEDVEFEVAAWAAALAVFCGFADAE